MVTKVEYNSSAERYMGQYANGAYGFVKSEIWQAAVMISQWTEQLTSFITQKLWGN